MSLLGFFGAAERNAENRRAEGRAYRNARDVWQQNEDARRDDYNFTKDTRDAQVADNEANLRFQEQNLLSDYNYAVKRQDYEFNAANEAYKRSERQASQQISYNRMAEENAVMEQNFKLRDDLLATMFDESDSVLSFMSQSSGLKLKKHSTKTQANFEESKIDTTYLGNLNKYNLDRNTIRADAQTKTQNAVVAGMKLAGEIRAKAGSGRSAAKAVLGAMAESGATRSAIANSLMYAEKGLDLGIAQLKDMLILDQTMIMAMRDMADNEYDLGQSTLDTTRALDKKKISSSKRSIKDRDSIVRKMITQGRLQADLNAQASVLMQPQRLPDLPDPRKQFAQYDNPATENYVEMLLRPTITPFPDFRPSRAPDRDDFNYGRENVGMSNFGDILKIGGMAASGIGAIGGIGAIDSGGGALFNMTDSTSKLLGGYGSQLYNFSSSFYPSTRSRY